MSWLTIPNVLTVARLISIPFIVRAILAHDPRTAFWLSFAGAMTDTVDGVIARRFHQQSRLGAYLDPVADKVFVGAILIAMVAAGSVPWWMLATVIARDAAILMGAAIGWWVYRLREFPPSPGGKLATFLVMLFGGTTLMHQGFDTPSPAAAAVPVCIVVLATGAYYLWRGFQAARLSKNSTPPRQPR